MRSNYADRRPLKFCVLLVLGLCYSVSASAAGPSLGRATEVSITGVGVDKSDSMSEYCADFRLSPAKAASFLNSAEIVTQREIHDHYSTLPCFVRGTARFHGYPATWEIRAGGTGSITLMSGEVLPIVDTSERYDH